MQRVGVLALGLTVLAASIALDAQPRGHTLFGDLKIDEKGAPPLHSITFQVVLQSVSGQALDRQTVSPGGRYRFLNVSNGEYRLVVEVENRVVARIEFLLEEFRPTDIRKDIELAWGSPPATSEPKAGETVYARAEAQETLLSEAGRKLAAGENDSARRLLEELLETDKGDFEAWTELGSVHFAAKRWDEAKRAYGKAIELRPSYFPAHLNLGKLLLARKEGAAAVEALNSAVQLQPRSAEAQYFLGEAYLAIKRGSLAVGPLEAALELEPDKMAEVHLRLATLYNAAGMKARAAEEYRRFLEKRPDSEQASRLRRYIRENARPPG